eukprot:6724153-Heterocapsa_arctica.AAC.1
MYRNDMLLRRLAIRVRRFAQSDPRFATHPTAMARGIPFSPATLYPYTPIVVCIKNNETRTTQNNTNN